MSWTRGQRRAAARNPAGPVGTPGGAARRRSAGRAAARAAGRGPRIGRLAARARRRGRLRRGGARALRARAERRRGRGGGRHVGGRARVGARRVSRPDRHRPVAAEQGWPRSVPPAAGRAVQRGRADHRDLAPPHRGRPRAGPRPWRRRLRDPPVRRARVRRPGPRAVARRRTALADQPNVYESARLVAGLRPRGGGGRRAARRADAPRVSAPARADREPGPGPVAGLD